MCSRYNLTSPEEAVRSYFGTKPSHAFPPRYNIAPTQPVAIVRLDAAGERELALVRWGLLPGWVKDPAAFALITNARAETAIDKPAFRSALRYRRCLVPANGFYEWTGPKKDRRPYHIRRLDGGLMALAGLYEQWMGPDGSELDTMAILTVPANPIVAPLHDRMPAILEPEAFPDWLTIHGSDPEAAIALLHSSRSTALELTEVNKRLNNSRNEGPGLLEPEGPPRLL